MDLCGIRETEPLNGGWVGGGEGEKELASEEGREGVGREGGKELASEEEGELGEGGGKGGS